MGQEHEKEDVRSYWMNLRKREILEFERSTRSHSVVNSLQKRLWTCCKTDCRMNDMKTTPSH
jgi:hypothetical protein